MNMTVCIYLQPIIILWVFDRVTILLTYSNSNQIQLILMYTYLFNLTGFLAVTQRPKSDTRLCNAYNVTGYIYQQYHLSILSHQIF